MHGYTGNIDNQVLEVDVVCLFVEQGWPCWRGGRGPLPLDAQAAERCRDRHRLQGNYNNILENIYKQGVGYD